MAESIHLDSRPAIASFSNQEKREQPVDNQEIVVSQVSSSAFKGIGDAFSSSTGKVRLTDDDSGGGDPEDEGEDYSEVLGMLQPAVDLFSLNESFRSKPLSVDEQQNEDPNQKEDHEEEEGLGGGS